VDVQTYACSHNALGSGRQDAQKRNALVLKDNCKLACQQCPSTSWSCGRNWVGEVPTLIIGISTASGMSAFQRFACLLANAQAYYHTFCSPRTGNENGGVCHCLSTGRSQPDESFCSNSEKIHVSESKGLNPNSTGASDVQHVIALEIVSPLPLTPSEIFSSLLPWDSSITTMATPHSAFLSFAPVVMVGC
jgi:hypothetical protein